MYTVDPSFIKKYAAAIMTPEAMQAATQPPPPPPPQGAPMDPAMGGAPMDPAMMPPPQGAPMDPAMMPPPQGAPMDPAMGGMPPGGAPMDPAQLQQMLMDFMAQNGITLDPASGQAFDQNGQPVPPQVLDQLFMQFQQMMMGGMPPPQGAPMDPSMMPPPGAPMDPAMGGVPMDPAMMPPPADPAQDITMLKQQLTNAVQSMVQAELAAQDKKIATVLDKVDTIKALLQQLIGQKDVRSTQAKAQQQDLNSMLQQDLNSAAAAGQQSVAPPTPIMTQMSPKQASINKTMSVLRTIRGK